MEDNTKEDTTCYECPIVYGTVETFARDILKTEFLLQDVRKGRKCDIVIVDEVDSMLIDQGVQCTYLSHDVACMERCHFEPILVLIWIHVNRLKTITINERINFHAMEPECLLHTLSRLSEEIDPLQIMRLAEEDKESGIKKGFTDEFLGAFDQIKMRGFINSDKPEFVDSSTFFKFAQKVLHLDIDMYTEFREIQNFISDCIQKNENVQSQILTFEYPMLLSRFRQFWNPLVSIVLHENMIKDRLTKMITDGVFSGENEIEIDLPIHLREYCVSRLRCWIDNAFLAKDMQPGREYIVEGDAIYPVDFESTGVIETNKKWGDGLQQFLEVKHGLPCSPLYMITNFLSNIDFFERYKNNIVGVSGTLGDDLEKKFMRDTFLVEFATIPTSKQRKLIELEGMILEENKQWLNAIFMTVKSTVESQRAVLVICEDILTADNIHKYILRTKINATLYLCTKGDSRVTATDIYRMNLRKDSEAARNSHDDGYNGDRMNKELNPGDVVITTNLGARGTDFLTDDAVNKNGGLFVLVTFIPLNDRVEKQAFGRTGRRGATGSCQIIVNAEKQYQKG